MKLKTPIRVRVGHGRTVLVNEVRNARPNEEISEAEVTRLVGVARTAWRKAHPTHPYTKALKAGRPTLAGTGAGASPTLRVRLTKRQYRLVLTAAKRQGVTLSEYVRSLLPATA